MMTVAKTIDVRISSVASRTTRAAGSCSASGFARILPQPPHHVLDVDDRIVHQRADRDRHAAERHRVDAGAERAQDQHGRRQRQRHRGQRDRARRAELARNSSTMTIDQHAAVAQRADDVVDGDLDEVGLPEDPPVDRHPGRQLLLQRVELPIEPRGQLDRVGAGLLLDADDDRRLAAPRSFAALERGRPRARRRRRGRAPSGRRASATTRLADLLRRSHAADRLEHVLLRAFRVDAGRGVLARAADGVEQLGQRDVVGAKLVGMRDHLELPLRAADRRHLRHARHGEQAAADDRVGDRAQRQRIVVRPTRSRRTGSRP